MTTQITLRPEQLTRPDSIGVEIARAVAAESGTAVTDLPPLYERINPEALESLFAPSAAGVRRRGRVEFTYCGYRITVSIDETATIALDGEWISASFDDDAAARSENCSKPE